MASLDMDYSGLKLVTLRALAGQRGMPNVGKARKAEITDWLNAHDHARLPMRPLPGVLNPGSHGLSPNLGANALEREFDDDHRQNHQRLSSLEDSVVKIAASLDALAATLAQDRSQPKPDLHAMAHHATSSYNFLPLDVNPIPSHKIHQFAPHVNSELIEAIANNTLAVWDFWRLDPSRAKELDKAPPRMEILDGDRQAAARRSSTRYKNFTDIVKSWQWFTIIRECFQPGIAKYLLVYLHQLTLIGASLESGPQKFDKILHYHINVVDARLIQGNRLDPSLWLINESEDIRMYVQDYNPHGAGLRTDPPARPDLPFQQFGGGTRTSEMDCDKYNSMLDCPGPLCGFRHRCVNCGIDDHPFLLCEELLAAIRAQPEQTDEPMNQPDYSLWPDFGVGGASSAA